MSIIERLSSLDFKEKLESWNYTLLDIRTTQEQLIFWVISENQIHIDIYKANAIEEMQKLPKEGKYLIYCYHGNRSQQVLSLMKELWFEEAYDLIWGIDEWKSL